ncbi:MAG: adenylate/guanylate cyclase domain-containing protein [Chloroflexota bacterium]
MLSPVQPTATRLFMVRPSFAGWRLILLALPLIGIGLLLARPELNIEWHHHPSHFWLVLASATVSVALAYVTNTAAGRHRDARVTLVSFAFLASAGFLGLHALATPGILVPTRNVGFMIANPVGLIIASGFALASVSRLAGPRADLVRRHRGKMLAALVALLVVWAAASLAGLGPLGALTSMSDAPMIMEGTPGMHGMPAVPPAASMEETGGALAVLAIGAIAAYAIAAWRYLAIHGERGGILPLATGAAFALLAEATFASVFSHNWEITWWAWHGLMLVAFAAIALGVRDEYRRSGSLSTTFGGLYSDATLARIDRWHADAIASVARAGASGESTEAVFDHLRRDGASDEEIALLTAAARELARLDDLFRPYLPAYVGRQLRSDPGVARLGGDEREVSVLFADLTGFTAFSEEHKPAEVIEMLNTYWAAVVPVIERSGGVVDYFAGDGVQAVFNAAGGESDHAERAVRAGVSIIESANGVAMANPGWPRFRVGVNTGPAMIGNVGVEGRRTFTAIGDTTNVAARLLAAAEPGSVVASAATWAVLEGRIEGVALGPIPLKGKRDPVEAWSVTGNAVPA